MSGRLTPTQIDLRNCSGGVANVNGRLACGNGGGGGGRGGYDRRDRDFDRDGDRYERRRSDDDYGRRPRY